MKRVSFEVDLRTNARLTTKARRLGVSAAELVRRIVLARIRDEAGPKSCKH